MKTFICKLNNLENFIKTQQNSECHFLKDAATFLLDIDEQILSVTLSGSPGIENLLSQGKTTLLTKGWSKKITNETKILKIWNNLKKYILRKKGGGRDDSLELVNVFILFFKV